MTIGKQVKCTFWILSFLLSFSIKARAADELSESFDTLGGNQPLLDKARIMNPQSEVRVVQGRIVPRTIRHEVGLGYENFMGGDPYLTTQALGARYQFHINPRWSIGGHYFSAYNGLSKEGSNLINNDFQQRLPSTRRLIPEFDPIQQGYYASANFYPIYGKVNFLGLAIVHFDTYLLGGYGKIEMKSGTKDTYLYGLGVGAWLTQHWTSRLELRNQVYQVERFTGTTNVTSTILGLSIGYLL
jgi:outer membrane beta-barrel protein